MDESKIWNLFSPLKRRRMPVRYIGNVGEIIDDLAQEFQQGKIRAMAVAYLDENDVIQFSWAGFKSYLEQVGSAVMLQETMFRKCQEREAERRAT